MATNVTAIRDKMYIETVDGLLFNVTGYEHPPSAVYSSLKYVDGKKWTAGYDTALVFLRRHHPDFVAEYIQVPLDRIAHVYDPEERWTRICTGDRESILITEAYELGCALSRILEIPLGDFAITDSLLWGVGHAKSDIDLLVVGAEATHQLLARRRFLYDEPDFARPDPSLMRAPYGLKVDDWPTLLDRKLHMGQYRDRLFSVRTFMSEPEYRRQEMPTIIASETELEEIEFRVADCARSLQFPAVYKDESGDELIDYSVLYEGVFRVGDVVRCMTQRQTLKQESSTNRFQRFVLAEVASIDRR